MGEVRRQRDFLHRARRGGLEPLMHEDLFALDSDQSRADIRRADAHLNRVTAAVGWLVKLHFELAVPLDDCHAGILELAEGARTEPR